MPSSFEEVRVIESNSHKVEKYDNKNIVNPAKELDLSVYRSLEVVKLLMFVKFDSIFDYCPSIKSFTFIMYEDDLCGNVMNKKTEKVQNLYNHSDNKLVVVNNRFKILRHKGLSYGNESCGFFDVVIDKTKRLKTNAIFNKDNIVVCIVDAKRNRERLVELQSNQNNVRSPEQPYVQGVQCFFM